MLTLAQGVARASELTSLSEGLKEEAAAARRENKELKETVRGLQNAVEAAKAKAR
jgi:hypothetical protein